MPESQDARLKAAIAHWAHRFFANGVIPADYYEVTASLTSWDEWCAAWCKRALVHEALGREALAQHHFLSAGEHLTRAGVYYHFAKFLFVQDQAQMQTAHRKAVECRRLALPHLSPPGERVEIPYEGKHLAGILRRPADAVRPGAVVMAMGLDSCKEEMDAYEQTFLRRGLATLAFDGPGQGEAEYNFPIRGDYEVPVRAVIDWLSARRVVAAAFEKRIKVCVALSGPYDWAECWDGMPELTRDAFRVRSHSKSTDEARQKAAALSLNGVASRITCPLFLVAGKLDRIVPSDHAERLAREVAGPVELLVIEDGTHVVNNRSYLYRSQTADWMAERLK